jgi:hypothetical protein
MGPRAWAAVGNVLRINAVFGYLGGAVLAYRTVELKQQGSPNDLVFLAGGATVATIFFSILLWNAKGPLISGNFIVRLLVGVWMLLGIVSSLGFDLIFIGIVYLFTGEPATNEIFRSGGEAPKSRFKAPQNWRPTGRIGPSGATVYSAADRTASVGILDSWIPVQVMDKRNGCAQVVAQSGEGGWIDVRTLNEGAA